MGRSVYGCGGSVAVEHIWNQAVHYVDRMSSHEWGIVMAAILIASFVWLRGFGSRSNY